MTFHETKISIFLLLHPSRSRFASSVYSLFDVELGSNETCEGNSYDFDFHILHVSRISNLFSIPSTNIKDQNTNNQKQENLLIFSIVNFSGNWISWVKLNISENTLKLKICLFFFCDRASGCQASLVSLRGVSYFKLSKNSLIDCLLIFF